MSMRTECRYGTAPHTSHPLSRGLLLCRCIANVVSLRCANCATHQKTQTVSTGIDHFNGEWWMRFKDGLLKYRTVGFSSREICHLLQFTLHFGGVGWVMRGHLTPFSTRRMTTDRIFSFHSILFASNSEYVKAHTKWDWPERVHEHRAERRKSIF